MQIVICDDSKAECDILREFIVSYSCAEMLDYVIEEFESAEHLLAGVKSGKVHPDILFMDIYMNGMSGMDAVKLLKADGFCGVVIFTTTSKSHAVESYKIMAEGYLVKPYTRDEFNQNFKRAISHYAEQFKTVSFLCDRLEYKIFLKDLEFVEAAIRGSLLHVKKAVLPTSKPLVEFAEILLKEDCFLRCHRGCIVNLNYVARVENDHILMKNGAKAPLTIKDRASVKKAVSNFFFLKMREE